MFVPEIPKQFTREVIVNLSVPELRALKAKYTEAAVNKILAPPQPPAPKPTREENLAYIEKINRSVEQRVKEANGEIDLCSNSADAEHNRMVLSLYFKAQDMSISDLNDHTLVSALKANRKSLKWVGGKQPRFQGESSAVLESSTINRATGQQLGAQREDDLVRMTEKGAAEIKNAAVNAEVVSTLIRAQQTIEGVYIAAYGGRINHSRTQESRRLLRTLYQRLTTPQPTTPEEASRVLVEIQREASKAMLE